MDTARIAQVIAIIDALEKRDTQQSSEEGQQTAPTLTTLQDLAQQGKRITFSAALNAPNVHASGFAALHLPVAPPAPTRVRLTEHRTSAGSSFWFWFAVVAFVAGFGWVALTNPAVLSAKPVNAASANHAVLVPTPDVVKPVSHVSGDPYRVIGRPTISATFINTVLCAAHSPACGTGQQLYNDGVRVGIDPAFALAFFEHESSYGESGMARVTLSLGNLRCITGYACVPAQDGSYAAFPDWNTGYICWYALIHGPLYVAGGLTTVKQIIPRYAPPADNNNDNAYIASVQHSIDLYREGVIA